MAMGDDSCLRGRGFKSQHSIMDGHFFALICCSGSMHRAFIRCRGLWPIYNRNLRVQSYTLLRIFRKNNSRAVNYH